MHKGNQIGTKQSSKGWSGDISYHFKDLHEAEESAEVQPDQSTFHTDVTNTANMVDGMTPFSAKHLLSNSEGLESARLKKENDESLLHKTSRSGLKHNTSGTGQDQTFDKIPVGQFTNTESVTASHTLQLENVKDHPLISNSSSSDDDFLADDQEVTITPSTPRSHPSAEARAHHAPIFNKGMLSSAIFNPKARTQLITTLKKNIQQYTNAAPTARKNESDYTTKASRLGPMSSRIHSPRNSTNKTEIVEEKRFSQDNDLIGTGATDLETVKSESNILKSSSSTTVSLSTLLTNHRDSRDGDTSLSSENTDTEQSTRNGSQPVQKNLSITPVRPVLSKPMDADMKNAEATTNSCQFSCTIYAVYVSSIFVYFYNVLPLPWTIHLLIFSFSLGAVTTVSILYIFKSPEKQLTVMKPPYKTQDITGSSQIPKLSLNQSRVFKGWMNQIKVYDIETYHISATNSVFITLEGSTLRLQMPRRNISRRASHGEKVVQLSNVISQQLYDLSKAKVYLVPSDLVKKRVWSKKYPICIEMAHLSDSKARSEINARIDDNDEVSKDNALRKVYLFGRTQPQKEQWFYRFQRAITLARKELDGFHISATENQSTPCSTPERPDHVEELDDKTVESSDPIKLHENYFVYMCRLLPDVASSMPDMSSSKHKASHVDLDLLQAIKFSTIAGHSDGISEVVTSQPTPISRIPDWGEPGLNVAWFNVVIGRIMFDFLRLNKWAKWMSAKIQKKLEKIKLPYFMEGLKLTEMDLGKTIPLVHKVSLPRLDAEGIWLEMDITYNGSVQMTLETKMVLTRLGKQQQSGSVSLVRKSAALNSDEEDSAESSEDEESMLTSSLPAYVQHFVPKGSSNLPPEGSKGSTNPNPPSQLQEKRWVRIVDSITKSKYFQRVTETNYIKKKLETVSNTPLVLTAELNQCRGTICINIPPPPSDRIWYGFKENPDMVIKARPKLGERLVTIVPITDWIEKKLLQEFNKVVLMPNMDDIPIPIMFSNLPQQT